MAGLVSIICYLLRDARENYYHNEFVFGILGIVLGAVVLYKVEIVISLIPFILGVLVLCSGCSKLQDAIDLKDWVTAAGWDFLLWRQSTSFSEWY